MDLILGPLYWRLAVARTPIDDDYQPWLATSGGDSIAKKLSITPSGSSRSSSGVPSGPKGLDQARRIAWKASIIFVSSGTQRGQGHFENVAATDRAGTEASSSRT